MDTRKLAVLLFTVLLVGTSICLATISKSKYGEWNYRRGDPNGPQHWGTIKGGVNCVGSYQSPIDVNTPETIKKEYPPFHFLNYDSPGNTGSARPTFMTNNGKALEISFEGDYLMQGGGLPGRVYRTDHMHMHWGSDNTRGSEHTINGQKYPGELHMIHYDASLYRSLGEAVTRTDGLANFAFFIKIGRHNTNWKPILTPLSGIKYAGKSFAFIQSPFKLEKIIKGINLNRFYRYRGSLTLPGCYESVVWTVFEEPIELSESQFERIRALTNLPGPLAGGAEERAENRIADNYRPIQRLDYRRNVYRSFDERSPTEYEYGGGGWGGGGTWGNAGGAGGTWGNGGIGGNPDFHNYGGAAGDVNYGGNVGGGAGGQGAGGQAADAAAWNEALVANLGGQAQTDVDMYGLDYNYDNYAAGGGAGDPYGAYGGQGGAGGAGNGYGGNADPYGGHNTYGNHGYGGTGKHDHDSAATSTCFASPLTYILLWCSLCLHILC